MRYHRVRESPLLQGFPSSKTVRRTVLEFTLFRAPDGKEFRCLRSSTKTLRVLGALPLTHCPMGSVHHFFTRKKDREWLCHSLGSNRSNGYSGTEKTCYHLIIKDCSQSSYFFMQIVALCPPKPSELDRAPLISTFLLPSVA